MSSIRHNRRPHPYETLPPVPAMQLSSEAISDGAQLDRAFLFDGLGGGNTSPELSWSGAPEGTAGFAVTCYDPDAPTESGFWHWLLLNIPADVNSLATGAGRGSESVPGGAFHLRNDYGTAGYGGAAPPEGDEAHRYVFAVHALSAQLEVDQSASPAVGAFTIGAHVLARGVLTPVYGW